MTPFLEVEHIIEKASMDQLPNLVGALSRLQAMAQVRLLSFSQPMPNVDQLLTVPQVAKRLQLSEYRVYEMVRQGALKSVRLGKSVRVRPSAVDEYLTRLGF